MQLLVITAPFLKGQQVVQSGGKCIACDPPPCPSLESLKEETGYRTIHATLSVTISPSGLATNPQVVMETDNALPAYQEAILKYASSLRFNPMSRDGRPVTAATSFDITFTHRNNVGDNPYTSTTRPHYYKPSCDSYVLQQGTNYVPTNDEEPKQPPPPPPPAPTASQLSDDQTCSSQFAAYAQAAPVSAMSPTIRFRKRGDVTDVMSCGRLVVPSAGIFVNSVLKLKCEKGKTSSVSFSFRHLPSNISMHYYYDQDRPSIKYIKSGRGALAGTPEWAEKVYLKVIYDNSKPNETGMFLDSAMFSKSFLSTPFVDGALFDMGIAKVTLAPPNKSSPAFVFDSDLYTVFPILGFKNQNLADACGLTRPWQWK